MNYRSFLDTSAGDVGDYNTASDMAIFRSHPSETHTKIIIWHSVYFDTHAVKVIDTTFRNN